MKAEDVVKAYHLLNELKLMREARKAFDKEGSTIEITGLPSARILLEYDSRPRFRDLLQHKIGEIVRDLHLLGVEHNEGNHASG